MTANPRKSAIAMDRFSPNKDNSSLKLDKNDSTFWGYCDTLFDVLRQKAIRKMSEIIQKDLVIREKRGIPVYRSNPSIPAPQEITKSKRVQIGDELKGFVVDNGTGEILGHGGAIAYEFEEVDKERFVKLYLAGLKQASGLSKAGLAVFESVYDELRENRNRDEIRLSPDTSDLPVKTFQRGLRELLEKEFLFRSPFNGLFFVNIRFMFNGDRLAFVKGYTLRNSGSQQLPPAPDNNQGG